MRLKATLAAVVLVVSISTPAHADVSGVVETGADGSTQEINAKVSTATVSESSSVSRCVWLVNPPISDVYPTVTGDASTKKFDNDTARSGCI